MIQTSILNDFDIDFLLKLPEVIKAKELIDKKTTGTIYFTIQLTDEITKIINDNFVNFSKIELSGINSIPMRWIKGDTKPHIDRGNKAFDKTYLAYLTDSQGNLVINEKSYPISKGNAYVFSEGLLHETIGTGSEPRLLLGPMSESGISVGSSFNYPGGTIVYISQDSSGIISYSINPPNWLPLGNNFPIQVTNSNTSLGVLIIEFTTNITLDDSSPGGIYKYFICQSSDIQFGSTTPRVDGTVPIITIDGISGYPGLINNGGGIFSIENGYNNITIQNIGVKSNNSSIDNPAGWICQSYFGRNSSNNNIINCYSTGYITAGGGGIVGTFAASNGGNLTINKCFSLGFIDNEAGGIVGNNAADSNGNVTITNCYSFGEIGGSPSINGLGGGIVGSFANNVNISNCYSLGVITGSNCGGIIGYNYANNSSTVAIENCYSIGDIIGTGSGGIATDISTGTAIISNCYTSGTVTNYNYGISPSGPTIISCYSEGNNIGSGWNDTHANNSLLYVNSGTWTPIVNNSNYLLSAFNQTIYNQTPYTRIGTLTFQTNPGLIQLPDELPDKIFKYSLIKSTNPNISIDTNTGAITIDSSIAQGTYVINVLCGIDPPLKYYNYNINSFIFTQSAIPNVPICFPAGTPVLTDQGEIPIDKINKKIHTINKQKIIAITESIPLDSYLICIEKNSLGYNVPNRRTITSKDHKIMCDKKLVRAEYLTQYIPTIYKMPYNKEKLYNVLLNNHSTMSINNLTVETMDPKNALAKLYMGNFTTVQKNEIIKILNKHTIKERKKSVISRNIFLA